MGLTYNQAKSLGLEHLWPTETKKLPIPDEEIPPVARTPRDGMNKTERAFWERIQEWHRVQVVSHIYREPFRLRLAGNTTYKPDFVSSQTMLDGCRMTCWEVKGFMRDDAAVKLKVAAELYPWMVFVLVTREKQKWACRYVTSRGILRDTWTPDWLK